MRTTCVALSVAAALGLARCQGYAPPTPLFDNFSAYAPPDCSPCGNNESTCCMPGETCTFSGDAEPACIPLDTPPSNATPATTITESAPEIARNTLFSPAAVGDASEMFTYLTSVATTLVTSTTEETIARTAEATTETSIEFATKITTQTTEATIARPVATTYATCNVWSGNEDRCGNVCCGADEDCSSPGTCTPKYEGATATYGPTGIGPLQPLETIKMKNGKDYQAQGINLNIWCSDQMSTCPLLCGGTPAANECYTPEELDEHDPNAIEVTCVCSDGTVPSRAQYIHTIEYHICQQDRDDCLNQLLNATNFSKDDQDRCFQSTCGEIELRDPLFNMTTASNSNIKPSTTIKAQVTTIYIPLNDFNPTRYHASVVAMQNATTTLKVQCDYDDPDVDCHEAIPTISMTMAPGSWNFYRAMAATDAIESICTWTGTANATCVEHVLETSTGGGIDADGGHTPYLATYTGEPSSLTFAPMAVTAGAYKLVQNKKSGGSAVIGVSAPGGGGANVGSSTPNKSDSEVGREVGASTVLVTLMLMLVLAL